MRNKTMMVVVGALVLGIAAWATAADAAKPADQPKVGEHAKHEAVHKLPPHAGLHWQVAVMTYTLNRFTLFEAIEKAGKCGVNAIESFAWNKISPKHGDMTLNADIPESAIQEVLAKLKEHKIELVGYYIQTLGKDEKVDRKTFEFCKKLGVHYIVTEPEAKGLPEVDKLAQEFKIKVAIHNHPKQPKHADYVNWDPENVMKMLEGRSKWIGCCADTGHWVRSGLDPVECIKKYHGRLVSMHLKDVNAKEPEAHDVPYGTGVVKLKDLLAEVKKMGFSGTIAIEYENNMENNVKDVTECVNWLEKAKQELGVK